jgi:hypothetical protein
VIITNSLERTRMMCVALFPLMMRLLSAVPDDELKIVQYLIVGID